MRGLGWRTATHAPAGPTPRSFDLKILLLHPIKNTAPAAFQRRKRGLSPEVQERIIVHMNKDHQAEVVLYARHFAGLKLANAATITAIDAEGACMPWISVA